MAVICAGCGAEDGEDVVREQDACPVGQPLFTYPLSLPPNLIPAAEFVMDDGNIYYTYPGTFGVSGQENNGQIMKYSIGGGEPVALVTGEIFSLHIAMDKDNIYWTAYDAIRKVPLAGGTPVTLATSPGGLQSIAVDAHYVYWTTTSARLMRVSLDGGEVTELVNLSATSYGFFGIALDAGHIYWGNRGELGSNMGSVLKMPIEGGPITTLATGQSDPSRIVVDANFVYWINTGDFNENVGLMKVPIDGGDPVTLVSTKSAAYAQYASIEGLFLDAQSIYWMSRGTQEYDHYDGAVMKMPVEGGAPTTLASAVREPYESIIVRGCSVYFSASGEIHRIGEPF